MLVIIIHELGHVLTSLLFRWKIKRIDITLGGGYVTYDDHIDKPYYQELLVSVSGFIAQGILFIIMLLLNNQSSFYHAFSFLINKYSLSVFLFNLIPVYPLDGSKILLVILNVLMPYKKALKCLFYVSLSFVFIIVIIMLLTPVKTAVNQIVILAFIISKLIKFYKDIPHLFNRLLFERYVYHYPSIKKYNYVKSNNLFLFKRRKKNYFYVNGHYVFEKHLLKERFD